MERFLGKGVLEELRSAYIKIGTKPEYKKILEEEKERLKELKARGLVEFDNGRRLEEVAAFNVGIKLSEKK